MSPEMFWVLSFVSGLIHVVIDIVLHQLIFNFALIMCRESASFEIHVFTTGIIIICFICNSLYGFSIQRFKFSAERQKLFRTGCLIAFLSILFAFTSDEYVPLFPVILSLLLFLAVSVFIRFSIRRYMKSIVIFEAVE